MKIPHVFILLLTVFSVVHCSKDDTQVSKPDAEEQSKPDPKPKEPKDEVYFSYYSDPNEYYAEWTDRWIVIHNQEGELLDYRHYIDGDSLDFTASPEKLSSTKTLSITTVNYKPRDEGGNFHTMGTATGIAKGAVWGWSDAFEPYIPLPPLGNQYQLGIEVINVPNVQYFTLSSQLKSYLAGHPFYQETNTLQVGSIFLQRDLDYLLSIRDGNDEVRYLLFELKDPISNITFDYNDFIAYDHLLEVELPEHQSYTTSVSAKNETANYFKISDDGSGRLKRSTAKIGYLDSFDSFLTNFVVHYNDYNRYLFYSVGERPTTIRVPANPQFQAEHDNIYDYSFTTDVEYYRNISSWVYEDLEQENRTRYGISGKSEGITTIGALPDEILEKHPHLNLDNLKYESTTLYIGENLDFKTDNRTTLGGFYVPKGIETLSFKNTKE